MNNSQPHLTLQPDVAASDGRQTGRRRQEHLQSNHGPIIDLSRGGARILATRSYKGKRTIMLISEIGSITIPVRIAWSQKIGFRRVLLGVEFLEIDEKTATTLRNIASAHAAFTRWAA